MTSSIYDHQLDQRAANYQALSPITFIERAAAVYPERTAVVSGEIRRTWAETYRRCRQLASALQLLGIDKNDTVSVLCPNTPEHFEAHFAVPMAGAVLNSINTRLDAPSIAFILGHSEAKVLIVDNELSAVAAAALEKLDKPPRVISVNSPEAPECQIAETQDYEAFLSSGDAQFTAVQPESEWDAISLNYTSGTTGDPKGVVYHHRGAYLNATSNAVSWSMPDASVYLWTLPMFHCNGWCFPWTIALVAGTSVCLRQVRADEIVERIVSEKVDHFCGAPIVLSMVADNPGIAAIDHKVKVMTAGAPPPAAVIQRMEAANFDVTHVYGLTETYGPCVVSSWNPDWDTKSEDEKARLKARQGVRVPMQEALMVANPDTLEPVRRDGETLGEVFMRGNIVMKGYLKNPATTEASFNGDWFHSGDLAVWHSDGYIEIKDRSKDIIISGGENISSIEIEDALYRHPAVQDVAIVAAPDEKWGETPCAFITLKPGQTASEDDLRQHCRDNLAHFKVPRQFVFRELPRTSTGKVQKFVLREWVKEGAGE